MIQSPINWPLIRDTLWSWLSDSTQLVAAWGDQSERQPPLPFAVLKVISGPTPVGRDFMRKRYQANAQIGSEVKQDFYGWRNFTLSVHVFSESFEPEKNAQHYLGIAQAALTFPRWVAELSNAKIAVRSIGSINDISDIDGEAINSHAQMDLALATVAFIRAAESTGFFESMDPATDLTTE